MSVPVHNASIEDRAISSDDCIFFDKMDGQARKTNSNNDETAKQNQQLT